jgi:hypothetical protein
MESSRVVVGRGGTPTSLSEPRTKFVYKKHSAGEIKMQRGYSRFLAYSDYISCRLNCILQYVLNFCFGQVNLICMGRLDRPWWRVTSAARRSFKGVQEEVFAPRIPCAYYMTYLIGYLMNYLLLSLLTVVEGGGSGQYETASPTSSKNVVALCTVVPPRTTLTPGEDEDALMPATIFASS